jgi:hypothetical protein
LLAEVIPGSERQDDDISKYLYRDMIREEARQMDKMSKKSSRVGAEELVNKLISFLPTKDDKTNKDGNKSNKKEPDKTWKKAPN